VEREKLYGNRVVVKYEVLEGMIEGG